MLWAAALLAVFLLLGLFDRPGRRIHRMLLGLTAAILLAMQLWLIGTGA